MLLIQRDLRVTIDSRFGLVEPQRYTSQVPDPLLSRAGPRRTSGTPQETKRSTVLLRVEGLAADLQQTAHSNGQSGPACIDLLNGWAQKELNEIAEALVVEKNDLRPE